MARSGLLCFMLAGLLAGALAGSGKDVWGIDTLVNYPPGQGRKTVPVQANDDGASAPIEVPCACSDADPRDSVTAAITYNCFHQAYYGSCNESYMFDANAELAPEGHCQISCGRCNCCQPVTDVLKSMNATRFLQALEVASPSLKGMLSQPGYAATVLVPTNDAFDAALEKHRDLFQSPEALAQILKLHILPPEPVRRGLWTSPFLSLGPKLYTLSDGDATLKSQRFQLPAGTTWRGGIAGFQISGPYNAARVLKSDVPACKSYVTVIDSVLLPFDPESAPAVDRSVPANTVASLLGAPRCGLAPNALIRGQELSAKRVATVADCCDACADTQGCSAFQYCAQRAGCRFPDGKTLKFGTCTLMKMQGDQPDYSDWNAITVPVISGYVSAEPAAVKQVASAAGPDGGARRLREALTA